MTPRSITFASVVLLLAGLLALPSVAQPASGQEADVVAPPRPLLPIPTARQLDWQRDEMRMFIHYGVNQYTDREWGDGTEDPAIFDPSDLDAAQWARVAKETGYKAVILTAKHHDGFALWPSRYTDHSVERSPWQDGQGDVVRELQEAAEAAGVKMGLYLSPWDRNAPVYGEEEAYNRYYMGQLRELLTQYGPLAEIWFDGAKGEDAKDMDYDFDAYWAMVRQYQPDAVMFSDQGPDIRWIGNERGYAGATNWSTFDRSKVSIGQAGVGDYLNTGERGGPDWVPGECNTSLRPGWFYHADEQPKTLAQLLEVYYKSVGRNCTMLLNVPPTPAGRFDEADVERLRAFKAAIDEIFATDLAEGATAEGSSTWGGASRFGAAQVLDGDASTYWAPEEGASAPSLTLDLDGEQTFNVVRLEEPITMGQRVARYRVEAWQDGAWQVISEGTTIGYKKLDRLAEPVTASRLRVVVEEALATPLLSEVGLHRDRHEVASSE